MDRKISLQSSKLNITMFFYVTDHIIQATFDKIMIEL